MGFRKEGGFGGGRGGHKKSFGGARFGDKKPFVQGNARGDRQTELFSAVCAKCQKACEVPFRPNGMKPVFCRDCFGGKSDAPRGDFARRDNANSFESRGSAPAFAPKPQSDDKRIDELKRQIDAVHNKLDIVVKMIENLTPITGVVIAEDKPIQPIKKTAKTKKAK